MKAHCLPFSQIPHTTRLFADFLAYIPNIRQFYPSLRTSRNGSKKKLRGFPTIRSAANASPQFLSGRINRGMLLRRRWPIWRDYARVQLQS